MFLVRHSALVLAELCDSIFIMTDQDTTPEGAT